MFEGLVRQLLLGYLGRYVKDIHKEQLKITLWNEEVLLENVELILEAFDYLQLPFALKQGRVGRLSIRIPWKKLGWDPIIISLEDVYVCASQRDDQEWSLEAVEGREFAGKRAKLAAAELAKLSRRVCDNDAGQSFISSITAKVLDSIQADVIFGLKLSSLTIMKQNLVGSFSVRLRGGQVSKTIEIKGLGFYCSKLRAGDNLKSFNDIADFKFWSNARGESNEYDHILRPFDVTVSLVVNRAGELDNDLPQYSINAELTKLVFSIDEFQLQQSFVLLDYLCTSRLREKYGRYRPRHSALSSKPGGWQRIWWQYAQQSVLSDVRKKLKKTSWRYLGQRLSNRRKYVNLYKSKLHCLHQEQSVDESVVRELEQIEKECDFDDILSYRTAAECELQEVLLKSSHSSIAMNDGTSSIEKSPDDEHSSGRSRGWLNWLSRGMLGATGTDDSSQFSGVVSDEVVKDIYEATEFHPVVLSSVDADGNDKFHICALKFSIGKMSATVRSRNSGLKIAKLKFGEAVIDCNTWEDSANVIFHIKSVKMLYPWTKKVILRIGGACTEENTIQSEQSSFIVQVDVSPVQDVDLSVKVMLQPLEAICDREFFLKVIEFSAVFMSFESHYERVIASLNGIEDDDARILSKVEYVLSNRKKVIWDISIVNVTVTVPWAYGNEEEHNLVLDIGSLHIKSKPELDSRPSTAEEHPNTLKHVLNSTAYRDFILGVQLQDLYNLFDLKLNDCEIKLVMPYNLQTVSILENFSASITLASCVIPEEAILNQLEVHFLVSRLQINLSPLIYKSVVGLIVYLDVLLARTQVVMSKHVSHHNTDSDQVQSPFFGLSISATLELVTVMLDLANDGEGSSILMFALQELDSCYSVKDIEECSLYAKALKIVSYPMRDQNNCHILASCGDASVSGCASQPDMGVGQGDEIDIHIDRNPSSELFFLLHYEVQRSVECVCNKLTVVLNNADLHCFPHIIGLLIRFFDQISSNSTPSVGEKSSVPTMDHDRPRMMPSFGFRRFGFSNFSETWSTDYANISLYQYPFITICNSGFLGSLDSSLLQSTCDWRKRFKLRDKKIRSPKCSLKKGCETSQVSSLMSTSCVVPLAEHCSGTNQFFVDISLCGIRIHFHDSSCIIGTVTIPSSKSSLMIHEESMDLLFSAEGLVLTSPLFPNSSHKWLWGPSLPNLSPIINLRARTGKFTSLSSQLEINLGIQHVCCVLPAEFLTIIIGYFSSADWGFNSTERSVTENSDSICTENKCAMVYKFEVLDSNLIVPVEDGSHQFLKVEMPQLYSSFIDNCALSNIVEDIPPEFMVAVNKVGKCNKCLNLFGRDLVVSFFLFKDGEHGCSMFDQDTGYRSIMLIAPLSADILVRIPMESETRCERSPASTCIMSRIYNCQLMVNDCHALTGFKVLLDVIDKFSCVDDESNLYRFDVLHFLHQKEHLEECTAVSPVNSGMNFMEVSCSVDSLLVNLHDVREGFVLQKPVAKLDMKFMFSASLVNETLLCLESKFSSAALYSLSDSLMLARCTNNGASSSVLDICFSKSGVGHELCVSLPCLDIWLHLSNWTELIELYNTCAQKMEKAAHINVSSRCSATCKVDPVDTMMMALPQSNGLNSSLTSHHLSENTKQGTGILILRSENIGITFRIPLLVYEPQMAEKQVPPHDDFSTQKRDSKFIAITVQSKNSELRIAGRNIQLKAIMDKISGNVMTCDKHHVKSLPFFQILQVNVATEICCDQMVLVRANLHVQCDKLDAWLSHQILTFWRGAVFDIPEAGSTQLAVPCMDLKIQFRKISLLISDGRWSCSEHLLEIVVLNFLVDISITEISTDGSITSELQVNYNNIRKVLWEPFIEPWRFQMKVIRKCEIAALLNNSIITDIDFTSTTHLNLNFTEPLAECIFRVVETIKDALGLRPDDRPENQVLLNPQFTENASGGRYAPYILQNLTSLPLLYHVYEGLPSSDEFSAPDMKNENLLQPGSSVPVYLNESPEDQLFRYRSAYSSDKLSEKQSSAAAHHFMTLQVDASSVPSSPISMDLVGLTYFEVDFSKASKKVEFEKTGDASKYNMSDGEDIIGNSSSGFVVPVVFDVSVQHYGKLIRLYSTVIISNATSIPLELRFDIPFGVSPKILDPIYPGQEFPLPLHLAGAGRMRWRPLGNSYLWSEAHNVSNILSLESKIGHLRSFVCYPSHPSSAPFRCCISVQNILLPTFGYSRKGLSFHVNNTCSHPSESSGLAMHELDHSKRRFIHIVTLSTPFLVKNYLPEAISLAIETSGISRTLSLSEIQTSFHDIDPSHDLTLGFSMLGFRPSIVKFARAETFSTMGKVNGSKFSLSETVTFDPELPSDSIHIVVEKMMDAFAGARELLISVPYILYNCTGFPIIVSHCAGENIGSGCTVSSCYDLSEQGPRQGGKDGLCLLSSSDEDNIANTPEMDGPGCPLSKNYIVSTRKNVNPYLKKFLSRPLISSPSFKLFNDLSEQHHLGSQKRVSDVNNHVCHSSQSSLSETDSNYNGYGKVRAFMYSPLPLSASSEIMVRVSSLTECVTKTVPNVLWSMPFPLVPPSGSTTVTIPQSSSSAAFVVSVTSSGLGGPFAGRTRAITFQPRYVISNACSKDVCYKQKGTDFVFRLRVGQHSHLHWTDTARELLVSVRFSEPGWQWSGSFLPDQLGDTQLKMRNYVSGALNMIRVEVQNADVSFRDEKIVGNLHGNYGTNLILLSDDETGYMPYRIDNFSKERLRIYQYRCETFDTIIHPYTSCPYAWDEPCCPHRLTVEVPGERVVGSYALDDLRELIPVHLQSTSEKPERTLLLSNHAEGATKVLSIVDSNCHILKDVKNPVDARFQEKRKQEKKQEINYRERISIRIPYIGISLINSHPQELLFACARNVTIDLLQSLDQQKLIFQISLLQIDNQLPTTPYPVILSFNEEHRSYPIANRISDGANSKYGKVLQTASSSSCEPAIYLSLAMWKKRDISLVSFQHINLRVADFLLELEQEVILGVLDFVKNVSPWFRSEVLSFSSSPLQPVVYDLGFENDSSVYGQRFECLREKPDQIPETNEPTSDRNHRSASFPSIVPIGAPWQKIYLLARRHKKIYVELLDLSPIKFTLSFSSAPPMLKNGAPASGESLIHRGLMALADVEGARIHLKQLTVSHHMASWESIQEILMRHFTRQLLHEMYKVFGSAGVIGNPMGFARSLGLGFRDFLSVPAKSMLQSPTGLISGVAQGTTSLVSNTVYALSDAATQFSKAAHKGIVAITFDDQTVARMEKQQKGVASHSKGVINEVLEGLTGLLQSPIKEVEKHGLPGVLSGIALGVTGLVARPAASILEVTGKTAQSIRNRSKLYRLRSQRCRIRLPRPLSRELPLRPYSWEEAIGTSVLMEADDGLKFKDEVLITCKTLEQAGKFVVLTERVILVVGCSSLVDLGKPEFRGVAVDPEWVIESEISLDSVIHADTEEGTVHIVGSSLDGLLRKKQQQLKRGSEQRTKWWNNPSTLPLFQTNLELKSKEDAEELLRILLSTIEQGKGRRWGSGYLLHQCNIK